MTTSYWKNKRVLVTGASGFIGSHIVTHLVLHGAIVTAITSPSRVKEELLHVGSDHERLIIADLLDLATCRRLIQNQEIVLNFAARDGGSEYKSTYPALIFRTNTQITTNILEASKDAGVQKVLLMSSTDAYSPNLSGVISEDQMWNVQGLSMSDGYRWSKRFMEVEAQIYAKQYPILPVVVRMTNVYGPNDDIEKGRVIPSFIQRALQNEDIHVWADSTRKISFLYIRDAVSIMQHLVEAATEPEPINVASDEYISLEALAAMIVELTGSKSKILLKPSKQVSMERKFSIVRMKALLSDINFTSLRDGLREVIDFYKGALV